MKIVAVVRAPAIVVSPTAVRQRCDPAGRGRDRSPCGSEVLTFIAQGLANQDIADRLVVSTNSVRSYLRSAYRKMDVTSRAQTASWCVRHGYRL